MKVTQLCQFRIQAISIFLLVTTSLLYGCGASTSNPGYIPDNYIVLETDGSIVAIDTSNPTERRLIEPAANKPMGVVTLGNQANTLVYVKQGRIYKVDLSRASDLLPRQVSNEAEALKVCFATGGEDDSQPGSLVYEYVLAGANGDCDDMQVVYNDLNPIDPLLKVITDNSLRVVSLTMGVTDSPVKKLTTTSYIDTANRFIIFPNNARLAETDPFLVGRLVVDANGNLNWYAGDDILTPTPIKTGVSSIEDVMHTGDPRLLRIDNQLFIYSVGVNDNLVQPDFTLVTETLNMTTARDPYQDSVIYATDGENLVKLDFTQNTPAMIAHKHSEQISRIVFSQRYLGMYSGSGDFTTLNRDTKKVFSLSSVVPVDTNTWVSFGRNEKIYYSALNADSSTLGAGVLNADGSSPVKFPDSIMRFVGSIDSLAATPSKLLLATRVAGNQYRFSLWDASMWVQLAELGTLVFPENTYTFIPTQINVEQIVVTLVSSSGVQLHLANANTGSSLQLLYAGSATTNLIYNNRQPAPAPTPTPTPTPVGSGGGGGGGGGL